ncbi:MAG: quinolinate synthase NadA [Candidatus Peregrinibacteria bacterium]|nr:quinolinate synthase NadA [Candidatus Peregrinibacteria bacterium]
MDFSNEQKKIIDEIKKLKKAKNAVILVHNYQRPEIYEVADFIGDSLKLCIEARNTNADIIVFCGVSFMAESAYILNPGKKVLVPSYDAGCAMADMLKPSDLIELKKKHPKAKVVTYINSSAEIKALSDAVCTSSSAVDVVKGLDGNEIIFVPDKNLAKYVEKQAPEKKIIAFDGYCPIHDFLTAESLYEAKKEYGNAKIIAHPESKDEILECADYISSTSEMINLAKKDPAKDFLVLTECGMVERLKKEVPDKNFHGVCNFCFDMKKNTIESVLKCLKEEKFEVKVPKDVTERALKAFDKMFELTKNGQKNN